MITIKRAESVSTDTIIAVGSLITAIIAAAVSVMRVRGESALADAQTFNHVVKTTLELLDQLQEQNEALRERLRALEAENRMLREELRKRDRGGAL